MKAPEFVLATLDEAAPSLAILRAALAGKVIARQAPPSVLAVVQQQPGLVVHDVAGRAGLSVREAEAQLQQLAKAGQVRPGPGEDGITRWWPVKP